MIELDGESLTLEDVGRIADRAEECALAGEARRRVERGRRTLEEVSAGGEAIYGVNTGFGDLARVRIAPADARRLQRRLLLSHAAGVGEPLAPRAVRTMLALRANALARGYSGVRPEVIDSLLALLAGDVLPVVPSRGSVGASGDLAPLAHLALPLIGEGRARRGEEELAGAEALAAVGREPVVLEAKEGLALINGTQGTTALLALAALEARRLVRLADLVGALSTDAVRGSDTPFDARLHRLRPHAGQQAAAANVWKLLRGSAIRESHRVGDVRVQDPYSLRCIPQVHGASRDLLAFVERSLAVELNAVTDNPLVFPEEGEVLSGGNFHAQPMAHAADVLAIGLAEIGSISERRIEKLTTETASGLPAFLAPEPGVDSGFMIAQVTAAALVAENKVLCHPASVDSVPTSAGREDHVSMGMGAALKLGQVVDNVRRILAVELLAACQGIDLLRPLESSPPLEALHATVRRTVDRWDHDRWMAPDLAAAERLLAEGLDEHLGELE